MHLKPIHEQAVVIMGASSGIGRDTALRFARKGACVVAAARSESGLQSLINEIRQHGGRAIAATCDTTNEEQVRNVAELCVQEFGRIDTWVQLAGVSLYARFEDTTIDEWRRVVDVNLNGQALGAMVALPHLKRQGGALICVSSVESRRALPYQAAYAASKHGVKAMCEALRMELEHEGVPVSVTEIIPASINTPLFEHARTKLGVQPQGAPPIYPPEAVSKAILYAAEHPVRELPVGAAASALIAGENLSPAMMDRLLETFAFEKQLTDRPKPATVDNLFAPMEGMDRVKGNLKESRPFSVYTWMITHPGFVGALAMAAAGTAAIMTRGVGREVPSREREVRPSVRHTMSHRERSRSIAEV